MTEIEVTQADRQIAADTVKAYRGHKTTIGNSAFVTANATMERWCKPSPATAARSAPRRWRRRLRWLATTRVPLNPPLTGVRPKRFGMKLVCLTRH